MTGAAITKSAKRRRVSLDVAPPAVRAALRAVLADRDALGLWILCAECAVDGIAAMQGTLDMTQAAPLYRHRSRSWIIANDDVDEILLWQRTRMAFTEAVTDAAGRQLGDWLRGPITTAVRARFRPAPWSKHVTIGGRLMNSIALAQMVAITDGNDHLLWELTGRFGTPADEIEPHSTDRVHRLIDAASSEFAHHPRVVP
jgi:hypothetical protein